MYIHCRWFTAHEPIDLLQVSPRAAMWHSAHLVSEAERFLDWNLSKIIYYVCVPLGTALYFHLLQVNCPGWGSNRFVAQWTSDSKQNMKSFFLKPLISTLTESSFVLLTSFCNKKYSSLTKHANIVGFLSFDIFHSGYKVIKSGIEWHAKWVEEVLEPNKVYILWQG